MDDGARPEGGFLVSPALLAECAAAAEGRGRRRPGRWVRIRYGFWRAWYAATDWLSNLVGKPPRDSWAVAYWRDATNRQTLRYLELRHRLERVQFMARRSVMEGWREGVRPDLDVCWKCWRAWTGGEFDDVCPRCGAER